MTVVGASSATSPGAATGPRGAKRVACQRLAGNSGSDRNPGTRRAPFETVLRLVSALRPGQTGCLLGGRFQGNFNIVSGGLPNKRITLRVAAGAKATICGYIEFKPSAAYWRLSGLNLDGSCSTQYTVQIYADHVTLDHDDITNKGQGRSCVLIGAHLPGTGVAGDAWVHHNRIHDCGPSTDYGHGYHGIYAAASRDARVVDNYIYGNPGYGMQLYPDAQGTLVERNVFDSNSMKSGLVFSGQAPYASSDNLVANNILSRNGMYGIEASWPSSAGTGNVVRANCFWKNGKRAFDPYSSGYVRQRNIEANPGFVLRTPSDYRLRRSSRCWAMQPRGHVGP